jgi:putative FmdB family regulatory protein
MRQPQIGSSPTGCNTGCFMPIYEYRCQQCGHELEKLQRMSDAPLTLCPACEEPGLRRLISAAGFRLKGGGWYETDFKQGQQRNLADSGEADKTSSGGNTSKADADAKPAKAREAAAKTDSAPKPAPPAAGD